MRACQIVLTAMLMSSAARPTAAESIISLLPDESTGGCQAVVVEGHALAHTGQVLPLEKQGNLVGEGSVDTQLAQLLFNLESVLAAAGSDTDHLVKLNLYVDSPRTAGTVARMFAKRFRGPVRPALSWVCTPLVHPGALVAADAVAAVPGSGSAQVVLQRCEAVAGETRAADVAVVPRGQVVYVSGVAEKGDMAAATQKSLQVLMRTIAHFGLDRRHVVQLKAFVQSIREADVIRQEVERVFEGQMMPPLVLVEWVSSSPVEIEMIAFNPLEKEGSPPGDTVTYFTPPGVTASPVYSRVARVHGGKRIYIAGLYADQPGDGANQVRGIFTTLGAIAKASGTDLRHLVKATYYVSDEDVSGMLNKLRPEYYDPARPPAASKAMVKGVAMPARTLTLDMIAVTPH